MKILPLPSQEALRERFDYDPETGRLTYHIKPSRKIKAGSEAGALHKDGGRQVRIDGVIYQEHRVIWKLVYNTEPPEVDHRNRCRSDNALRNLRAAERISNSANQTLRARNRLGVKGVYERRPGQFIAQTKHAGVVKYLGSFKTAQEAHNAYMLEMIIEHGVFASDRFSVCP